MCETALVISHALLYSLFSILLLIYTVSTVCLSGDGQSKHGAAYKMHFYGVEYDPDKLTHPFKPDEIIISMLQYCSDRFCTPLHDIHDTSCLLMYDISSQRIRSRELSCWTVMPSEIEAISCNEAL